MTRVLFVIGYCLLALTAYAEFRVGAAAVRITPDKPTPLAGYYNARIPTNTHDELQAKAIVLEQDGVRGSAAGSGSAGHRARG